jgi:hypothetical protein
MSDKLPGVLGEIAELVGEQAAIAIASRAGGTRVYFPAHADDKHWLVQSVGRDAADKVCAHFTVDGVRGQRIEIPLFVGGTYRQAVRAIAERVHKMDKEGASSTEIVRKVGVTQRSVHRHRARHRGKKDDKQGRLL